MGKDQQEKVISEDEALIYGAYIRIAYDLQRSNRAQITYKGIAITWMIATFIGIGYLPSSFEINLPADPLLLVAAICLASFLVLVAIWYRDLIVEEKRIATAVHRGIALEDKHPSFLPQVYHNVVKLNYLLGYVSKKSIFYLGLASILFVVICSSITVYFFVHHVWLWWMVPFFVLFSIPIILYFSSWMTKKTDPYLFLEKLREQKGTHGRRRIKRRGRTSKDS